MRLTYYIKVIYKEVGHDPRRILTGEINWKLYVGGVRVMENIGVNCPAAYSARLIYNNWLKRLRSSLICWLRRYVFLGVRGESMLDALQMFLSGGVAKCVCER